MNFQDLLNNQIKGLNIPRYDVADFAPETFQDLVQHFSATKTLVVWSGASDNTVWGQQGNWQFRAWHDWVHILVAGQFEKQGEILVMREQQRQVSSTFMQLVLEIEILGQLKHQSQFGTFPVDQIEFFKNQLNLKGAV
jgi:hypothetical protein